MATKVYNKTILQTSFTSLESIYYLLQTVKDNQPMTSKAGKDKIFPQARAKISQARGGEWSEDKRDTHAELTLSEMRFIRYIDDKKTIFEVSDLGNEFLNAFDLKKTPSEDGKFSLTLVDKLQLDDKNQLFFEILNGIKVVQNKYGRKIRPYQILFKLLVSSSFRGYISKSEWAYFINCSDYLRDSQFEDIKKRLLDVRRKKELVEPQKSDRILTRLVLWKVLDRYIINKDNNNYFCFNNEFIRTIKNNFYMSGNILTPEEFPKAKSLENQPLQQIFYGAPGTGKSFEIKRLTKDLSVIRTTFHPDSDYSTFLGTYKPTMTRVRKTVVIGQDEKEVKGLNGIDYENKIQYSYVGQAFLKAYLGAWKKFTEASINETGSKEVCPQVLVIEEINRGNCAQIFGDLFQLLDRQEKNGFSCYPIESDTDLQLEIENAFKNDKNYQLRNDINVDGAVDNYTSNFEHEDGSRCSLSEDIQAGRILLLPKNLYIWATMNTSDQSLFPIDSAFKRRWEWVYMPIKDHQDKGYKIVIDGTSYDWWGFLEKINSVISTVTNSEDKKLGYFFVVTDKEIDAKKFVGKVLFYLWNDVFKNYGFDNPIFNKEDKNKYVFSDFFQKDGSPETENIKRFLKNLDETIDKENPFTEKKSEDVTSTAGNINPDLFANQE